MMIVRKHVASLFYGLIDDGVHPFDAWSEVFDKVLVLGTLEATLDELNMLREISERLAKDNTNYGGSDHERAHVTLH